MQICLFAWGCCLDLDAPAECPDGEGKQEEEKQSTKDTAKHDASNLTT